MNNNVIFRLPSIRLLIAFTSILSNSCLSAQFQEPSICFGLEFKDDMGNIDSISIGFDIEGTWYEDSVFGEMNIKGSPYNSVFEIRAGDTQAGDDVQNKSFVHFYHPSWCDPSLSLVVSQYVSVLIHADHWPVTVYWDKDYFQDSCYEWSHFTRITQYIWNPWVNGDPARVSLYDSLVVHKHYIDQTKDNHNWRIEPMEDGGQDTVFVLYFGLAKEESTISTDEKEYDEVDVIPNPANNTLNIKGLPEAIHRIELFDLSGRQVRRAIWHQRADGLEIDVSALQGGLYQGKAFSEDGRAYVFRFVKME